jgi:hypothetical protein
MKTIKVILAFILGIAVGASVGSYLARARAHLAVAAGPDSDNYRQARSEISEATAKLRSGNSNVIHHLIAADAEIEKAQQWTERFLGRNSN